MQWLGRNDKIGESAACQRANVKQVGIRQSASEDEACRYMLETLLADRTTRGGA